MLGYAWQSRLCMLVTYRNNGSSQTKPDLVLYKESIHLDSQFQLVGEGPFCKCVNKLDELHI